MMYTEEKFIPGIALFIDFRKGLNTIEWYFVAIELSKIIYVSLYADDTTVFVLELDSDVHLLTLLYKFNIFPAWKLILQWTEGNWLSCCKNNAETPFGFRCPRDPIKALQLSFLTT